MARNLRRKTSQTIGVIVHELNSHFIVSVLSGIEMITAESHYNLIIGHSDERNTREVSNVLNFLNTRVDGIIASLASDTEDLSHYDAFIERGIPIVFFDRVRKNSSGIKVIIDNEKAGYDATTHLVEQGCRNIMHVTGNLMQNVYSDRLNGFRRAIEEHGLSFTSDQLVVNNLGEKAAIEVADQILKMETRPDGIFCTNDLCACLCMQKLMDEGIKVPEDIAIIGFNDDIISRVVEPKLSTIQYDGREIGKVAARSLISQLNSNQKDRSSYKSYTSILRHELLIRDSSRREQWVM